MSISLEVAREIQHLVLLAQVVRDKTRQLVRSVSFRTDRSQIVLTWETASFANYLLRRFQDLPISDAIFNLIEETLFMLMQLIEGLFAYLDALVSCYNLTSCSKIGGNGYFKF